MSALDRVVVALTGQEWLVVRNQIYALVQNVLSWALVTVGLRRRELFLAKKGAGMNAVAIAAPGGFEQFQLLDLDAFPGRVATVGYNVQDGVRRVPGHRSLAIVGEDHADGLPDDCVLVRVQAFSINYADVTIRWGLYESAIRYVGYPIVPGFDLAGVVEQAGPSSGGFAVGDRVTGVTFFGGYSARVLVPGKQLRKVPAALSTAEAAALPSVAGTALHALSLAGFWPSPPLTTNRAILIHSAAGGVGSMLVQMARLLKCSPIVAVVGANHKIPLCEKLGADVVIDKSSQNLWEEARKASPGGYAAIMDANGISTLADSYRHLARAGRLVVYGFHTNLPSTDLINPLVWVRMAFALTRMPRFDPMDMVLSGRSVHGFNLSFFAEEEDLVQSYMTQIFEWVEGRALVVGHTTEFGLHEVPRAHELIQSGLSIGKIICSTTPKDPS